MRAYRRQRTHQRSAQRTRPRRLTAERRCFSLAAWLDSLIHGFSLSGAPFSFSRRASISRPLIAERFGRHADALPYAHASVFPSMESATRQMSDAHRRYVAISWGWRAQELPIYSRHAHGLRSPRESSDSITRYFAVFISFARFPSRAKMPIFAISQVADICVSL